MDFIQCLHNLNHQTVCRLLRLVCFHKDDLHSQKGWILTRPIQLPGLHDKNCKVCQLDCLWNSPTTFLCCSVDHGSFYKMIIFKKSLLFIKESKIKRRLVAPSSSKINPKDIVVFLDFWAQKPKNTRKSHRKLMSFRCLFGLNFEDEGATGKVKTFWFVKSNATLDWFWPIMHAPLSMSTFLAQDTTTLCHKTQE